MGKGGTRFVGEAVGVRSGRAKAGLSAKQMAKDMEHFQKTGQSLRHADICTHYCHAKAQSLARR